MPLFNDYINGTIKKIQSLKILVRKSKELSLMNNENDQNVSRYERWLSPKEVADLLGLKISWVYAQTRLKGPGSIPRLQCGKHIRFDLNEVIDWIDDKYGEKNENENSA